MSDNTKDAGTARDDAPALDDAQLEQVSGGLETTTQWVNRPGDPPPFIDPESIA